MTLLPRDTNALRNRPVPEKPGRRERRSAETREKIFRSALELFATRGFLATRVEDITEAADVGKGAFYNYFPSKEHLLAAFGELQRRRIEQAIAVAQEGRRPVKKVLKELLHRLSEEPGRSPALFRSMLFAILSSEAVRETVLRNLELSLKRLEELLAIGQQRGEIRRDRPASEIARVLQRSSFGAMLFWALRPVAPLAEQLGATFDLFWYGIAGAPAASLQERRR